MDALFGGVSQRLPHAQREKEGKAREPFPFLQQPHRHQIHHSNIVQHQDPGMRVFEVTTRPTKFRFQA